MNELRPNGPILQQLTLPRSARAAVAARLSVRALSWGAPIQQVRWNLGDGTSAKGATVKHRYRRAGKYTVTVSASDANGSATLTGVVRVTRR